jgi:hypothetical protein
MQFVVHSVGSAREKMVQFSFLFKQFDLAKLTILFLFCLLKTNVFASFFLKANLAQ